MFKKVLSVFLFILLGFGSFSAAVPTAHAAGGIELYTSYAGISVTPGESIDYNVDLINTGSSIKQVSFEVKGLPKDWSYKLTSGGWDLNELAVKPGESQAFTFTVNVPQKVDKGTYNFTLSADGDGAHADLPLSVTVTKQGTFKTELNVEQPNMQGHADSDFTYTATLENHTADKQRYALSADAPKGWDVVFKADGKNVTSVVVEPGSSKDIDVTLNPPEKVKAKTYKVMIKASNGSTKAQNVLEAVITGTYELELTTPSGRLSTDITAGDEKTIQLKIVNNGSSPLRNISLSADTPPGWKVEFEPNEIDKIDAGKSKIVEATITASDKAIAGDYVVQMSASADEASDDAEFRISVKTSLLWGWVGVLVVIAVVAGIYYLFRTYGRR
ncbi:MAG TPA: NEW3 domain-containing protein [Bacillales bacterium]|nr:NEW3 domain-containing protein [Bacillales bacterium]